MPEEFFSGSGRPVRDRTIPVNPNNEGPLSISYSAIHPHHLIFTIYQKGTKAPLISWNVLYPTRDAALSQLRYIEDMKRKLLGPPAQAWSEIARISKCKAPHILAANQNLQMTVVPKEKDHDRSANRSPPSFSQPRAKPRVSRPSLSKEPARKDGTRHRTDLRDPPKPKKRISSSGSSRKSPAKKGPKAPRSKK